MELEEQAREFLDELNKLIEKTDMRIIRKAESNVQFRLQKARERNEDTELWIRLVDLVDGCKKCKRVLQ